MFSNYLFKIVKKRTNANNYKDGDIPRENMDIMGPSEGFAYYKSSKEGKCEACTKSTNNWYVNIKSKGKYLCVDCRVSGRH